MRGTRSFRAVVLAVAVTAAIAGVARPAFALDPPATTPTFTAPAAGSTVGGFVTVTATSTAPAVQFYGFGEKLGDPVPVVDGSASATWETWGNPDGGALITAADCNDAGCGPTVTDLVNMSNPAPVITAPADGATTGPLPDISATSDAGGVRFQVDDQAAVDVDPPFQFTPATRLTAGQHTVTTQACHTGGAWCNGVPSTITINVAVPSITSLAPNPFSPNGDGLNDATTIKYSLPDTESVSWSVVDTLDSVVRGPVSLGELTAGSHSIIWGGFDNAHVRVPDATYQVVLSTSIGGGDLLESARASVRVDTAAPVLGVPSGAGATFYPVRDGFRDTFTPKVSVNEPGTLWLNIRTADGHNVRLLKITHAQAGAFTITWGGLDGTGHLVPAGTYRFHFIADDVAGNRRIGASYNVIVSWRHIVTKTAVINKPGSSYDFVASSASCAGGSKAQSAFAPTGLRLHNVCTTTAQAVVAQYSFRVPGAMSYSTVRVSSYAFSPDAPVGVATLIWNFPLDQPDVVAGVAVTNRTAAWTNLGAITANQHVSATHLVQVAIALTNVTSPAIYDVGQVRITITYRALS